MKYFSSLIFLIVAFASYAQTKERVVQVIKPKTIFVNSRTNLTGSNQILVPVQLPVNTKKWYYTFTASRNVADIEAVQSSYNLFSKLSYLVDESGTTANIVSLLGKPPGGNYCDAYLLSTPQDASNFREASILSGPYYFDAACSQENIVSGVQEIANPERLIGTQYLGFKNRDHSYGITVGIEVVAIVDGEVKTNGWTKDIKNGLFNEIKKLITENKGDDIMTEEEQNSLVACLMKKLTSKYSPDDLGAMADYEAEEAIVEMGKDCDKELNLNLDRR